MIRAGGGAATASKTPANPAILVGNVCKDRTTVLTEEFDILFDSEYQPAAEDDSEMMAEPVGSSDLL
jgi:hypothetical protein